MRDYDPNSFPSDSYALPASIEVMIRTVSDYADFRMLLETGPHATIHKSLGGQTGDLSFMTSSNDPIFFLHHSMIDNIWWRWQEINPDRIHSYPSDIEMNLNPFKVKIKDIFQIDKLCYAYEQ